MTIYDNVVVRRSISPAVRTNGTVQGSAVSLGTYGAESCIVVSVSGTITDGTHAVTIEESQDGSTGWGAVDSGRLFGSLPSFTASSDDAIFEVGVTPTKPFVRPVITTTGATTGGTVSCVIVIGDVGTTPVSHA